LCEKCKGNKKFSPKKITTKKEQKFSLHGTHIDYRGYKYTGRRTNMDYMGNTNLVCETNHDYEVKEKLALAEQIMTNKEKKIAMHDHDIERKMNINLVE
jgi:hypothetical protein